MVVEQRHTHIEYSLVVMVGVVVKLVGVRDIRLQPFQLCDVGSTPVTA